MVLRVALIVQFIFKDAMTCVGLGWIHPFERLTFESSCISRIQPNALSNWCATHDSGSRILLLTLIFERLFGWGVYKRRMPVWVGLRSVWSHTRCITRAPFQRGGIASVFLMIHAWKYMCMSVEYIPSAKGHMWVYFQWPCHTQITVCDARPIFIGHLTLSWGRTVYPPLEESNGELFISLKRKWFRRVDRNVKHES